MKQVHQNPKIGNGTGPGTALWQRINEFNLDEPGVIFPFSRKLAKENNWEADFTTQAIAEYKKFTYLCCVLPRGASPSYVVDQVWHMHLIYTQNYWERFCDSILEQKLHHHPSTGGTTDQRKHEAWRRDTLDQYRLIFGEEPPPHIWTSPPPPRKSTRSLLQRLFRTSSTPVILLACSTLLSGCGGPASIAIFCIFIVMLFVSMITFANRAAQQQQQKKGDPNAGSSDGGGSSGGCSSGGCGSGCGGGCGGCGGGGCGS